MENSSGRGQTSLPHDTSGNVGSHNHGFFCLMSYCLPSPPLRVLSVVIISGFVPLSELQGQGYSISRSRALISSSFFLRSRRASSRILVSQIFSFNFPSFSSTTSCTPALWWVPARDSVSFSFCFVPVKNYVKEINIR